MFEDLLVSLLDVKSNDIGQSEIETWQLSSAAHLTGVSSGQVVMAIGWELQSLYEVPHSLYPLQKKVFSLVTSVGHFVTLLIGQLF